MAVRIVTLPGLRVLSPRGEVTALASGRQSRALLVYLAVERSASRDTLLGLLWPERDEVRARHSLSQTIYELRQAVGEDCLRVSGDTVTACEDLETDVARFEAAVEGGRWAEALELYGGGFLEGVHLAPTHPFEEWLDRRRAQVARLHRRARREVVAARLAAADLAGALVVAQRWAELEPLDDEAQQRTIELLARTGHRAEALAHYERFRERLRQDELEPMPELAQLAASIAAGGLAPEPQATSPTPAAGRPPAPAAATPAGSAPSLLTPAPAAPGRWVDRPPWSMLRQHLRLVFGGALLIMVALAGWLGLQLRPTPEVGATLTAAAAQPPNHVAVLYFEDRSRAGDKLDIAAALTDALIGQLTLVRALTVTSRAGVERYRSQQPPLDSIGRALGVGTIVTGTVLREGDSIHVSVQLVDPRTSVNLDQTTVSRPEGEMFPLVEDVVRDVSIFLRRRLGDAVQEQRWQAGTPSQEAWQLVQRSAQVRADARQLPAGTPVGELLLEFRRADSLLARAERADPKWNTPRVERARNEEEIAKAYFGVDAAQVRSALKRGIDHANRALGRDRDDAEALAARGVLRFWDMTLFHARSADSAATRAAAESDLRAAVARDPHHARAWSTLSTLRAQALDYAGALAAARRALQEDPYATDRGEVLWNAYSSAFELADDASARSACDELVHRDPHGWVPAACALQLQAWSGPAPNLAVAAASYAAVERVPGAVSVTDRLVDLAYAAVLARAGLRDSAHAVIARSRDSNEAELLEWEAKARLLLREDDMAVELLRSYLRVHPNARARLARERCWQRLRANPAFRQLVGAAPAPAGAAASH